MPPARLDLLSLTAALARHQPKADASVRTADKAAVAAIVRDAEAGLELLFIRRAEHPRDPWSGQMGFPGGRVEPGDPSPFATAVRETHEELGLDLASAGRDLGPLSEVRTHLAPGGLPRSVAPFAFALDGPIPPFTQSAEVQEALWVPLSFLADRRNRHSFTWVRRGVPLPMPCYDFQGRTIWGLTLRIVDELLELIAAAR